jgi:hypothetical protein
VAYVLERWGHSLPDHRSDLAGRFRELLPRDRQVFSEAADGPPDLDRFADVNRRYGLEMDFDTVPEPCNRFDLTHPMA